MHGCEVYSKTFTASGSAQVFLDCSSAILPTFSPPASLTFLSQSTAIAGVYTPIYYTPTSTAVYGYLQGIDNKLGTVVSTTARSGVITVSQNTNYTITNPAPNTLEITLISPAQTVTLPPVNVPGSSQVMSVGEQNDHPKLIDNQSIND